MQKKLSVTLPAGRYAAVKVVNMLAVLSTPKVYSPPKV